MTIDRVTPDAVIVSQGDRQATFINATFAELLEWAYAAQHFGRRLD